MNKKKVLAMLMAAAMVFSTAIAGSVEFVSAEGSTSDGNAAVSDGNAAGQVEIDGEGQVDYVNTKIYNVTLPTNAAMNLTVDPQGLAGLENNTTASAEDLADGAGLVVGSRIPAVVNNGSLDAKVSVKMKLTGDATVVDAKSEVNVDDENNLILYAIPSATDVTLADATGYTASSTGIVLGTDDVTAEFILPAADYVFSKDGDGKVTYVKAPEATGHGTALKFEGLVNKDADWSTYAGADATNSIGIELVFSFTHNLTEADVVPEQAAAYGMMTYAGTTESLTPADAAPSVAATMTYDKATGGDLVIPFNLGAGESGADALTDIVFQIDNMNYSKNGSFGALTNTAYVFTINDNNVTVSGTEWMANVGVGTYNIYLVFDGDTENYKTVTLTVQ